MWRDLADTVLSTRWTWVNQLPQNLDLYSAFVSFVSSRDRPKHFIFSRLTLAYFIFLLPDSVDLNHTSYSSWISHVVVVIAQQLISYRQLSRLRKFATAARFSHRYCTVKQRVNFKVMVLVYKSLHCLTLPYLSDDCQLVTDVGRRHLWSVDVHTCTVPRTHSRLRGRSFGVSGPRLWNSLPSELRQQDICLTEFRQLLKTFLFVETWRIVTSLF